MGGSGDAAKNGFCLALVEIGCGLNVPTIRHKFWSRLEVYPENAVLVRVNPDFPLVLETEGRQHIEVMSTGLPCILEVDRVLRGAASVLESGSMASQTKPKAKAKSSARGKSPAAGSRPNRGAESPGRR